MGATISQVLARLATVGIDASVSDGSDPSLNLGGITHDSRAVQTGQLFCCVTGESFDGHNFASDAIAAGAVALLVERPVTNVESAQIIVPSVRAAMGFAAASIFGDPAESLVTVGITGTNGKTTVSDLIKTIMDQAKWRSDVVGTLHGPRTTPEAPKLQAKLADLRDSGHQSLVMEVSSHALTMNRVNGMSFDVAIFTNLSQDHLDFHPTMEDYFAAKASLFRPELCQLALVNVDDEHGRRLADSLESADTGPKLATYSLAEAVDLRIDGPISHFSWRGLPVTLQLGGSHNVSNALAAAACAEALGIEIETIADALCAADPPRGRFELVNLGQSFVVAVDYAHTPDALDAVLGAAREVAGDNRVIVVFGCGGDRDSSKRPLMGAAAVANSDLAVVTSDNPRSEDPDAIIAEVLSGIDSSEFGGQSVIVEPDRGAAIRAGLAAAKPLDVVIIAGKGHETTQTIGDEVIEFDDRQVVIDWIGANQ